MAKESFILREVDNGWIMQLVLDDPNPWTCVKEGRGNGLNNGLIDHFVEASLLDEEWGDEPDSELRTFQIDIMVKRIFPNSD